MYESKALFRSRTSGLLSPLLIGTWLSCAACTGQIDGGPAGSNGAQGSGAEGGGSTNGNAGNGMTGQAAASGAAGNGTTAPPGALPGLTLDSTAPVMRRLNRVEYNNTVRDLLQTTLRPADSFPLDQQSAEGFDTVGAVLHLSPLHVEEYETAAIALVDELFALPVASPARQKVFVCALQAGSEPACVRQILAAFMPRAYRRPVTDAEVDDIAALVTAARAAGNSYDEALKAGLEAVLLSPHFIFHVEHDAVPSSPDAHGLSDYELASRLSYFLWSSMPDGELFASAEAQRFTQDPAEIGRQVARMLDDPKASALVDQFASQWLTLNQLDAIEPNAAAFPTYDAALKTSAKQETREFFRALVEEDLPIDALLLADFTIGDTRLAAHYGLGAPGAPGFSKLALAGTPRVGVLTQASVMMANAHVDRTSPVLRGVWVLERLLCSPPPPPPANLDVPAIVETRPGATLRQSLEEHRSNPACAACHSYFDPVGLAFENFDGIGSYRTVDNGIPVDATGTFNGVAFNGPGELASILVKDARFAACMAQQLLTYAVGRSFGSADGKSYANAVAEHARAQGKASWRSFIEMVVMTEAFRTRRGVAP